MKKLWCPAVFLLLCVMPAVCADVFPFRDVPDSSEIRSKLVLSWFERDIAAVRTLSPVEMRNSGNETFQVRFEETDSECMIIVAPRQQVTLEVTSERGTEMRSAYQYRAGLQGSWVLYRSKKDGAPLCIRYYFLADPDVYVQFRPGEVQPVADLVIFSAFAARDVPAGRDFSRFYTASFAEIFKITSRTIPWHLVSYYPGMYDANRQMTAVIREKLPGITAVSDSACNESGFPVSISNPEEPGVAGDLLPLSAAGFVKWIVDGLVMPRAGSYLFIEPLKQPTFPLVPGSKAETVSAASNIYFALDWTRNLAAAALSVNTGKTIRYQDSGVDVKKELFPSRLTDSTSGGAGFVRTSGYIVHTGYEIAVLKPLLYVLAVTEPDRFYLGAVRETDGKEPETYVYNHCAAFFPYFDEAGRFAVAVFESGRETDIDAFSAENAGRFVHLTRIKASEQFKPQ